MFYYLYVCKFKVNEHCNNEKGNTLGEFDRVILSKKKEYNMQLFYSANYTSLSQLYRSFIIKMDTNDF